MDAVDLSIIVPCYNEQENILLILNGFCNALKNNDSAELILVDNGSSDETGRAIDDAIKAHGYPFARKIRIETNVGYGHGILEGLRAAKGRVLAWTHADLQTDPEDVIRAYQVYRNTSQAEGKVLVKGHRRNRALPEKLLSLGMQLLSSCVLGIWVTEVNAQPKLFPRSFFEIMLDPPEDFSLDLYALYMANKDGYKIISIPVTFKKRIYGEAKGGGGNDLKSRWKLIRRTVQYIFRLKSKVNKNVSC